VPAAVKILEKHFSPQQVLWTVVHSQIGRIAISGIRTRACVHINFFRDLLIFREKIQIVSKAKLAIFSSEKITPVTDLFVIFLFKRTYTYCTVDVHMVQRTFTFFVEYLSTPSRITSQNHTDLEIFF
jgi:hypothetical protein